VYFVQFECLTSYTDTRRVVSVFITFFVRPLLSADNSGIKRPFVGDAINSSVKDRDVIEK
jgi:hypothetical protein